LPFQNDIFLRHYRIDHQPSNAYAEWMRQGKPMYPTAEQYAAIKSCDNLEMLEPPQKLMLNAQLICLSILIRLARNLKAFYGRQD